MFLQLVFASLSLLLTVLFFLYGFNHYYLLGAARRYRSPALKDAGTRPLVSVQLPIYNEKYVVRRLVAACARMAEAYGVDKVRVLVVDDSDDDTLELTDEIVAEYRAQGLQIEVLRRAVRQGFKAGALQVALERTDAEYVVIFDADFIPPADFLVRTVPYFLQDERLGALQTRWTHLNRDYSFLTRAIAVGIDVHFLIEQTGRFAAGCLQNFNGSAGVLRTRALREAGGWQSDTLAEDLDVSYRMQIRGYRFVYLRDLTSPGEIPPTVPSFKKQQGRWACGSLRTARKLLPALLAQRELGFKRRLEAFIHLTGYMVHPLMFSSFVLACLATLAHVDTFRVAVPPLSLTPLASAGAARAAALSALQTLPWVFLGAMIVLCTVAVWITPVVSLRVQRLPLARNLPSLLVLYLLGCGVSLSNTLEAGKALLTNRDWAFKRTPKYAIRHSREGWRDKRYQVPLDFVCLLELAFVCLGIAAIADAIGDAHFGVLLILIPYVSAYGFVALFTIRQSRQAGSG